MKAKTLPFLGLLIVVILTFALTSCSSRYENPPIINYKYEVGQLVYVDHEPFIVEYQGVRHRKALYTVNSLVNPAVRLKVLEVYINPANIKIKTYGEERRK